MARNDIPGLQLALAVGATTYLLRDRKRLSLRAPSLMQIRLLHLYVTVHAAVWCFLSAFNGLCYVMVHVRGADNSNTSTL